MMNIPPEARAALHSCYFTGPELFLTKLKTSEMNNLHICRKDTIFTAILIVGVIVGFLAVVFIPYVRAVPIIIGLIIFVPIFAYGLAKMASRVDVVRDNVIVINNIDVDLADLIEVIYFKSERGGEISPGIFVNTPFDACLLQLRERRFALAYKGRGCRDLSCCISKLGGVPLRELLVEKL